MIRRGRCCWSRAPVETCCAVSATEKRSSTELSRFIGLLARELCLHAMGSWLLARRFRQERKQLSDHRLVRARAVLADLESLGIAHRMALLWPVPLGQCCPYSGHRLNGAGLLEPSPARGGVFRHFLQGAGDPRQPL